MAVLPVLHRLVQTGEQSPIRASRPAAASVEVIAPPATAVDVVSVLFAWRPVEGASTYRLTVTDSSGALVLTKVTSDTTIVAPPSASFHRGSSYLWYVDCLTTTGRTVSSGIRSFSTSR